VRLVEAENTCENREGLLCRCRRLSGSAGSLVGPPGTGMKKNEADELRPEYRREDLGQTPITDVTNGGISQ